MTISLETVGRRVYVLGNTYPIRDRLKSAGCSWDAERRQWWIGTTKRARIEMVIGQLADEPEPKESLVNARVYGKVRYSGKSGKNGTYYVIGHSVSTGQPRLHLANLQGSIDFWVDESACQWERQYKPRLVGTGRYAREEHQTLGGLQDFIERQQKARRSGEPVCAGCGRAGGELVRDLEDGLLKHYGCCDIPG